LETGQYAGAFRPSISGGIDSAHPWASPCHALAGLLTDQDSVVRRHSVYALGEIGGEYAMMYLLQACYDPDGDIRANAEEILMELEY